ncbi:MAG: S8 family serine peptidase [Actinobacteria bacterium]|nr:S8 family serine peptidase [Actinomycetota bacterium]
MRPIARPLLAVLMLVAALGWGSAAAAPGNGQHPAAPRQGLPALLAAAGESQEPVRAILRFQAIPTADDVAALSAVGVAAQPMKQLPLAIAEGTVPDYVRAVAQGLVEDVYPDRTHALQSADSVGAMGGFAAHDLGFTGEGIGVAVVDTGVDGAHPDLDDRVVRNVKVVSPAPATEEPAFLVAVDALPHDTTDSNGHGTGVAGTAVADGSAHPELLGVAPGADLVSYGLGSAVVFVFSSEIIVAYDDILATHEQYNIRVVNNSFGRIGYGFDPGSPFTIAHRALHDAGVAVVFAAGNFGAEMTLSTHALSPWAIAVGATSNLPARADFSSLGLPYDNSTASGPDADGHYHFEGDRLGLWHPDVMAPGDRVVMPSTPPGNQPLGPAPEDPLVSGRTSGTSFSAPHVTGLVAVLLEARPELTPEQVAQVLQVTARPLGDGSAFWQSGYGMADAAAAIDLVTSPTFSTTRLAQLQARADRRVLAARDHRVLVSDHWDLNGANAGERTLTFTVDERTEAIHASIAYPIDIDEEWQLRLLDADGREVGVTQPTTSTDPFIAAASVHIDFDEVPGGVRPGTWTAETIGSAVGLAAIAQLQHQEPRPLEEVGFEGEETLSFSMTGGPTGGLVSPEGCDHQALEFDGDLSLEGPDATCHSGGFVEDALFLGGRAELVSEPLPATSFGGPAQLRLHVVDEPRPLSSPVPALGRWLYLDLDAVDEDGRVVAAIAAEQIVFEVGPTPSLVTFDLDVMPVQVPTGSRLRARLLLGNLPGVPAISMRLLWGGDFSASGLDLSTGSFGTAPGTAR